MVNAIEVKPIDNPTVVAPTPLPRKRSTGNQTREERVMAERTNAMTPRTPQRVSSTESLVESPFGTLQRFADEMDNLFDDFGLGRGWMASRLGRNGIARASSVSTQAWAPHIDVYQQKNELVVRADLPGMKKDDVCIDVTDTDIAISGERRADQESEREGVYRSERVYGSFYRTIPLPEGAIADQAKATFDNGVLEIRMPAPPEQVTRGRRLEIGEKAGAKAEKK
jgi:HSP20 family protein